MGKYQYSDINDSLNNPHKFGAERIQYFSSEMITLRFKTPWKREEFVQNYDGVYIASDAHEAFSFRYEVDIHPPY